MSFEIEEWEIWQRQRHEKSCLVATAKGPRTRRSRSHRVLRKNVGRETSGRFLPAPISSFLPASRPPAAGQGAEFLLLTLFPSLA